MHSLPATRRASATLLFLMLASIFLPRCVMPREITAERLSCLQGCASAKDACILDAHASAAIQRCDAESSACVEACPS
jgi:hypothetical protein